MTATDVPPLACDPSDLNERMASWITSKIGTKETTPNGGPEINEWLRLVGLPTGNEWCAATVYAAGFYSSRELGIVCPVPRTAGALKLWSLADPACHVLTPARGRVGVIDHGGGKGHAVICTLVDPNGLAFFASGNTNAEGSRVGNCVAQHSGDPGVVHHGRFVGWCDFSRAVTRPALVA